MKKIKSDKNGFTLVELLVVLVIVGILAAMMVPALTGYIKKQKEKEAIQECRQVVAAAQNVYMDKATKNQITSLGLTNDENKEIIKTAGVSGSLQGTPVFDGTQLAENQKPTYKIKKLSYKSSGGIGVKYNAHPAEEEYYTIIDIHTYSELDDFIKSSQEAAKDMVSKKIINEWASREQVTSKMLETYGGRLPQVDPGLMTSNVLQEYPGNLYWQPYYIGNNVTSSTLTILFATPQDGSNTDSNVLRNGWRAYLVYVNGKVYEVTALDKNKNPIGTANIAPIKDCKTEDEVRNWLLSHEFREI